MGDEDVGGLDVAVDDLAGVEVGERVAEFGGDFSEEFLVGKGRGKTLVQRDAVHPFHFDAVAEQGVVAEVPGAADGGVVEAVADFEFFPQKCLIDSVFAVFLLEGLEDDELGELGGSPDFGEAGLGAVYELQAGKAAVQLGLHDESGFLVHGHKGKNILESGGKNLSLYCVWLETISGGPPALLRVHFCVCPAAGVG